ncbi:serine/threonine-protein kinase [Arenimonas fontis]|uniref:non-specific serine/threonine protein kinase n=1 Tax=Arenimonas fontis TaxID=2608255 RepID=A0A5B2ZEY7_9GAMM|nr:serine/threonine-protein kinase [Arenimonas fontis]KAA2285652.1 serine/threonine protein kinase [Arenimonas fontis]
MNATVLLSSVDIDIPGYRIVRPIGEGGMASVFLAVQESLDREVALKVMSPALAANAEFAGRFLSEGRITAKLQHPNLVTIYDIGSHAGIYYLAAEYIPGGTLKERIAEGGLSVAEILDIAADVAGGLDFAHQKGFVHRDVKPANILFRNDGRAVLADFGIAKALDGSGGATVAGASIGTPDYMSPEQARGEAVDGRSDLYSLGTVLYEMLTGQTPYQSTDPFTVALMHVTHPVPELPPQHAWLQPLLDGLMAKDANQRFSSGAAFVEALHRALADAPPGAVQSRTERRAGQRLSGGAAPTQQRTRVRHGEEATRPTWLLSAAGGTGVLAVVLLAWTFWPTGEGAPRQDAQPPAAGMEAGALPPDFQVPRPVDAPDAAEIERLLNAGDQLLDYGTNIEPGRKLTLPEDDSALGYYRQVLAMDPGNARARAGIANLLVFYRSYAYRACSAGRWTQCGIIVRAGLGVDGRDEYLLMLQDAAAAGEAGGNPELPAAPPAG